MRTWRATSHLVAGAATSLAALPLLAAAALALPAALARLPLLPPLARTVRVVADEERRRVGAFLGTSVPSRYAPDTDPPARATAALLRDRATYRDLAWLLLHAATAPALATLALTLWLTAVACWLIAALWWAVPHADLAVMVAIDSWPRALTYPVLFAAVATAALRWALAPLATAHARTAARLLGANARTAMAERVATLAATRAAALDAHIAELRRIERDLHDGAQSRLVAVAIQLGVAQTQREHDPAAADALVERARTGLDAALTELQHTVRGICPPILADRGLDGALHALAADSPVPVASTIATTGRLPAAVEAAAYFIVAEAVSNAAKYSRAARISVDVAREATTLAVTVSDDGRGGADEAAGTGLAGMRHRAAALDGAFTLSSPAGGPTVIEVRLPCG